MVVYLKGINQNFRDIYILRFSQLTEYKIGSVYPEKPEYFTFIDDNPYVHKLLPYAPILENNFLMEGAGQHEGLFKIAFYPHNTTQKHASYLHNSADKLQFSLK